MHLHCGGGDVAFLLLALPPTPAACVRGGARAAAAGGRSGSCVGDVGVTGGVAGWKGQCSIDGLLLLLLLPILGAGGGRGGWGGGGGLHLPSLLLGGQVGPVLLRGQPVIVVVADVVVGDRKSVV